MTNPAEVPFVEVYRARNAAQAHLIRNALEDAEIPVQLENDILQGLVGEMPWGDPTAPRLLVEETRVAEARAIIEKYDRAAEPEESDGDELTRCLSCGAPMSETDEKCSACGWSYEDEKQDD